MYATWSKYWREFFSAILGGKLEEAEEFEFVFVVYCAINQNRSAPVRDLLRSG